MKARKFILFIILFLGIVSWSQAKVVDQAIARKAAVNLFYDRVNLNRTVTFESIQLASSQTVTDENQLPLYHVFTFNGGGFVIITADDALYPILGYSPDGNYSSDPSNCCFNSWMADIQEQIKFYRNQQVDATAEITALWNKLLEDDFAGLPKAKDGKDIEPLMMSNWGQGKYYNTLTPAAPTGEEGHTLTGCVATSMAQEIFYYRYPQNGQGTHGYYSNNPNYGNYGYQFVDYTNTTFVYNEMVHSPNEANLEIAKLMYACGVAVDMSYGVSASGSYTTLVPSALSYYFKYSPAIQYVQRMSFSASAWIQMLADNLDAKKPLIYSGRNTDGGHAWNCDGYQIVDTEKMFHFNWGWDGSDNGYYYVNNLAPGGQPAFNQDNGAVRNIYPGSGFPEYCTSQKVLTGTKGTFDDGSGLGSNYTDNSNCSWLIAPTDTVTKISLTFNKFSTEGSNDVVTVYDGDNTSAPVLLTHSGSTIPSGNIMSTGNRMLVTFTTDGATNYEGFYASFKSTYPKFCQQTNLTANSGTVSDGSGPLNYLNNSTCSWTIQPPFGKNLNLNFTYFDIEPTVDYIRVYDLSTQTLLGTYSGNTLPPQITAPSGSMYIEFKSNYVYTFGGWEASYSVGNIGFDETSGVHDLNIYPNPASTALNINFTVDTPRDIDVQLANMTGQIIQTYNLNGFAGQHRKTLDLSRLAKGVYMLKLTHDQGTYTHRVVVQ